MDANTMHTRGEGTSPSPAEETSTSLPPTESVRLEPVKEQPVPPVAPQPERSSPGIIVLQWLTYAFWGWLILGLLWLMSVILINNVLHESVSEMVPYAIAASVVLLPLAFFCDLFYRKHEPVKKAGAAMVIMVIHAVLFATLGIISLIIAVFTGINALINGGEPLDNQMVILSIALFAALLYAAAFLRTLNPFTTRKLSLIYGLSMVGVTVILLVFTAAGPLVATLSSRGDRAIEQGLPDVQSSITNYINKNNKLPATLNDVTLETDAARTLVKDNKVSYKVLGQTTEMTLNNITNMSTTYRYQLCVDYTAAKNSNTHNTSTSEDGYAFSISTYSHSAGHTCYNLEQMVYQKTYQ